MSNIKAVTFTPDADCHVIVTALYECLRTTAGTDWSTSGNTGRSRAYVTQNGATVYGDDRYMSGVRGAQGVQVRVDCAGGLEVVCGLDGQVTGLVTCQWFNVQVQVEVKKR